jgi:hypothetical protein
MPENELARDCVMPEGPPDDMKIVCALVTSIPRDGDNNSEMWTTVDPNKTNVRAKAVSKLIQVLPVTSLSHEIASVSNDNVTGLLALLVPGGQELLLRV